MKLPIILLGVALPVTAMAVDMSDCVQIGYLPGGVTTCTMYANCMADHGDEPFRCNGLPKTDDECAAQIARQNAESAANDVLMKCPMTPKRRADKTAVKDHAANGPFVTMDGAAINLDDLIADDGFVYYTRLSSPMDLFFSRGNKDVWHAIGPRDADGLYLSIVE